MKQILFIVLCLSFLFSTGNAQVFVGTKDINLIPDIEYIEVEYRYHSGSYRNRKFGYFVDYGQEITQKSLHFLVEFNPNNSTIFVLKKFHSPVGMLNWFAKKGWSLLQVKHQVDGYENSVDTRYIYLLQRKN